MDETKKATRKIRKQIRENAKKEGISTDEYRNREGITKDTILEQAKALLDISPEKPKEREEYKPYDDLSNRPKFSSLKFGKPMLRIVHSSYGYDFLVYLADNGHYLPKQKIYRKDSGQASFVNRI